MTIAEGGQATFEVRLTTRPSTDITVETVASAGITSDTDPNTAGTQTTLAFPANSWNVYQMVTVSALHDGDTDDETARVLIEGVGGDYHERVAAVTVTITDDDKPTIVLSDTQTLSIDEGGSGTFSVSLSAAPNADVTVSLTKTNSDITLSPTSLPFTTTEFGAKSVTVNAAEDDDAVDDTDTITLSATGYTPVTKSVDIDDNDTAAIDVNPPSLTIAEGGQTTFQVKLATQPSGVVRVFISASDASLLGFDFDPNTVGSQSSKNFGPTSSTNVVAWDAYQTVTVSATHDNDTDNESVTISASGSLTAPAEEYRLITAAVAATIIDDDGPPPSGTIQVTPSDTLTIAEGGSGTFRVRLSVAPNANVTISLSKTNSDITLSPSSLTFSTSNFATEQEVSVSADEDADTTNDSDTITLSASGGITAPNVTKAVSVTDTTPPTGTIQVTPSDTLTIAEGGSGTFRVRLSTAPNANVTISLSKTNSDITLSPSSLTFSTSNFATEQEVSVSADEDADTTNDSDTITLSASGGITAPNVTKAVSVTDTTPPTGTIQVTPSDTLTIAEGGSGTFRVRLSVAPNANVTISLSKTNSDITLSPSSLTFSTSNFATEQEVSVSADEDADTTNDSDTITLSASGGITAPNVTKAVSVTDTTPPTGTIQVTPSDTLTIAEGGSGTFRVRLSTAPNANVTISLSKTNSDITLSPSSLTFSTSNFATEQEVSVSADEDADTTNDSDTITLSASGGITAPNVTKAVTVTDNDGSSTPSGTIQVTPSRTLTIAEGSSGSFDVSLSAAPNANVRVSLTKTNSDITLSPSSLTFTTSNYGTGQRVTVNAAEDADTTNDADTITLTASGGISAPQVRKSVSVRDNDSPRPPPTNPYDGTLVFLPAGNITIDEEDRQTVSVKLSKRPTDTVSVLISKTSNTFGIGFSREGMVFTPTNWDRYQSIDIIAHKDSDKSDDSHFVSFEFAGKRILRSVVVRDNDKESLRSQALALPPPTSGDSATLRIRCLQDSPCAVALDCSAQADGEVFQGRLPEPIPAWGTASLSVQDIQAYTGGKSWSGKGRLGCALRSSATIGSQVWTRSGNGVLVNNSAMIRSVAEGGVHRADIESIPSPDSSDESNIRIRCNSQEGDCFETSFVCYTDDGSRYEWSLGRIERLNTRHLQSEELARGIGYRWDGLGLTCEVRSSRHFTAQVLTRTGGGGALVNNSATGVR